MSRKSRTPRIPDPKPPIDVEEAARLLAEGRTYADIGAALGYRASSVRRCLLEHGVRRKKLRSRRNETWGERLHSVWKGVRSRAGEHGIDVSEEWQSFDAFYDWARASGYRPKLIFGRKDEGGAYSPANCHWTARRAQHGGGSKGTSRRPLTEAQWKRAEKLYLDKHLSCPEIARRLGVAHPTIIRGFKLRGCYVARPAGMTGTPSGRKLYSAWIRMRSRCTNPNDSAYQYYGGKGATVCREWDDFAAFHDWALAAGWKPELCLTRKQGHVFSPANCAWVTRAETARAAHHPSSKMPPHWTVTAFGETKGPTEWSRDRRCTVTLAGLLNRLRKGWDPEDAISRPSQNSEGPPPWHFVTAFGVTKNVSAWAKDKRCKVTLVTLLRRIERGVAPEDAIATPPFRAPRASSRRG